ncbi:MAG: radical SAM protein [Thermoplasmata archaeon]|nr:MAG: radical SAM protein [Thermoplasmata archaeon]
MVRFRIHLEPPPEEPKTIPSSIRILAFNITDKCNLGCLHCFAQDNRSEMTTEECKEVILQAKTARCVRVILCGKEPLMREDIFEILNYIKERGMDVELMTNGTLITQETLELLKAAGVSKVQISIDGFKSTHDELRCMDGAYDLAYNSVKLLIANGFSPSINTVVLKENMNELPDLLNSLILDFPVLDELRLSRLIPSRFNNPDYEYFEVYKNTIKNVAAFLLTLDRPFHIEIEDNPIVFNEILPPELKKLVSYTPCGVITHTIDVLNNGDVVFCVPMGSHSQSVIHGNILKEGLENIISRVRKYKDNDVDDSVCRSCEFCRIMCLGGWRCVAFAYRQNEYLADPFCPRVREALEKKLKGL